MTPTAAKALCYITTKDDCTMPEIMQGSGIASSSLHEAMASLVKAVHIIKYRRPGHGPGYFYRITGLGKEALPAALELAKQYKACPSKGKAKAEPQPDAVVQQPMRVAFDSWLYRSWGISA